MNDAKLLASALRSRCYGWRLGQASDIFKTTALLPMQPGPLRRTRRAVQESTLAAFARLPPDAPALLRGGRLGVLLHAQLPGHPQRAGQHILACGGQSDVRHAHASPPARDRKAVLAVVHFSTSILISSMPENKIYRMNYYISVISLSPDHVESSCYVVITPINEINVEISRNVFTHISIFCKGYTRSCS